jgi:hypothetical protein
MMTRRITTGFETGDTTDIIANTATMAITSSSPTPRTGGYCLRLYGNNNYATLKSIPGTDVTYQGIGIYIPALSSTGRVACFLDTAGNGLVSVGYDAAGKITLYRGEFSTLLDTSLNQAIFGAGWYYFEVYALIANSGGRLTVKVDGAQTNDFTGDTEPGSNTDIYNTRIYSWSSGANYQWYDDIAINDDAGSDNNTWPGQVKLLPFRPTGAGDNTGLTPSSGSNWDCVDEVPASATDYVYDTVVDEYDLYAAADPSLPDGAVIQNVIVIAHAAYDSGGGNIAPMMKSGSTSVQSADQALSAVYRPYEFCRALDPNGDIAWAISAVNALQIGVKVR